MPANEVELDCEWTVNEVITRHPETAAVFNRFGLDTCCGSMVSVKESARREGVSSEALCSELHAAVRPAGEHDG